MALNQPENTTRVVDRVDTPRGELVLRQDGEHFEVISNGTFLMDTRNGESERALIQTALRDTRRAVLIGGLGVGFSLVEAQPSYQAAAVQAYLASGVALPPATKFNAKGRGYPDVSAIGQNNVRLRLYSFE